jgi:hypothetical protein
MKWGCLGVGCSGIQVLGIQVFGYSGVRVFSLALVRMDGVWFEGVFVP